MLTLNLYKQFSKKENSTKQPGSGALTLAISGILKDPCSILNPVIRITRLPLDAAPFEYTYAKWVEFGKYYFIDDWSWNDGFWEVHLREDILATFKTQIGNATEYVLRTDSITDFNEYIMDVMYPATADVVSSVYENASPFSPASINSGCYVVGIIAGGTAQTVGAISYYAMNSTQFESLKNTLFSNANLVAMGITDSGGNMLVTDMSKEVLKTMYNPYQYIASCMWFPINLADIVNKDPVTTINIGWWPYTLGGYILTSPTMVISENPISLPSHPQANARGSYLNYAPYTRRTLYGRFGTLPIDTTFFKSGDSIEIKYYVDLITGQCRTVINRVRSLAQDFITERNFLLATPIQIAQVGVDYLGTAATAISTGATAAQQALTLNFGGAVSTLANGIYNTIQASMPQLETGGSNGSFLSASVATKMVTQFYKIVDEDIDHRGRPLCELRQLNTLSGYILCAEGELDVSAFDIERKEINRYLTTGFFME